MITVTINGYALPDIIDVTIRDFLSGKVDECEVNVLDRAWKWFAKYRPMKGDLLSVSTVVSDAKVSLGEFRLQSWRQAPGRVTLTAQAANMTGYELRAVRSCVYKDSTLRGIVSAIAQRNGLELYFDGDDYRPADAVRQVRSSDLSFLMDLGECCGFWAKLWGKKLIFRSKRFAADLEHTADGSVLGKIGAVRSRITITPADIIDTFSLDHKGDVPDKAKWRFYKPVDAFLDNAEVNPTGGASYAKITGADQAAARTAALAASSAFGAAGLVPLSVFNSSAEGAQATGTAATAAAAVAPGALATGAAIIAARVGMAAGLSKPSPLASSFPGANIAGDTALEALLSAAEISLETFGRADLAAGSVFNLSGLGDYDGVYLIFEMSQVYRAGWRSQFKARRCTAQKFTGSPDAAGAASARASSSTALANRITVPLVGPYQNPLSR